MGQYIVEATGQEYEEDAEGFGKEWGRPGLKKTPAERAAWAKAKFEEKKTAAINQAAGLASQQLTKNFVAYEHLGWTRQLKTKGDLGKAIRTFVDKYKLADKGIKG